MVKVNRGFRSIGTYLFEDLRQKAATKGNELIQLVTGNPDIETPSGIRNAVAKVVHDYYPNPPSTGTDELREAISTYYRSRFGVELPPANIIIGHGTKSDLWDIGRVFSNPQEKYIIPDPTYSIITDSGYFENRMVKFVQFTKDKWIIPDEFFDDSIALIYLCNPNNPNGVVTNTAGILDIVSKARNADTLVVSDIVYADFQLLGINKSPSVFQVEEARDVAVELGGFKVYSMTGYRISWLATLNDRIAQYWKRFKSNRDKGTPVYTQAAALAALTDISVQEEIKQNLKKYRERAVILKEGFGRMGLKVHGLDSTPFAWVEVPSGTKSNEFSDKLLHEASVLIVPGTSFGKGGEGYFRVSIFAKKEEIEEALTRIESVI